MSRVTGQSNRDRPPSLILERLGLAEKTQPGRNQRPESRPARLSERNRFLSNGLHCGRKEIVGSLCQLLLDVVELLGGGDIPWNLLVSVQKVEQGPLQFSRNDNRNRLGHSEAGSRHDNLRRCSVAALRFPSRLLSALRVLFSRLPSPTFFPCSLCVDELHLGRFTLLLCTDPIADLVVAFALVSRNDKAHMRRFLANLKNWGLLPRVVVSDGSNLYPAVLAELWPYALHQLCVFHILKDINDLIIKAVRRLARAMSWAEVTPDVNANRVVPARLGGRRWPTLDRRSRRRRASS